MGDVLIARRGSATLVKLLRRMRLSVMSVMSVMSRRRRSTIFSHGALVGVKCMTRRGCRASQFCTSGRLYVAFFMGVFARRIVGWRVSSSMRTDFVLDALEQALYDRQLQRDSRLIRHRDRGSQ